MSDPSLTSRKVEHATNSIALNIGDKVNKAHFVVHLDKHYDVVNVQINE